MWVGMLRVVYCRLCGVGGDVEGGLLQAMWCVGGC